MASARYAEPILIHLYSEVLQNFRLAAQGKASRRKPPAHLQRRIETYFDPLPFYYEPLEVAGHRQAQAIRSRGDAAADGDVPLLGFAERLAAPDPRHNTCTSTPKHRARRRHRRRRLDVGRVAMGQGALHGRAFRGRRARHRLDLERHRQGRRRLEPGPDANESSRASCSTT
jgi:hypothetical protein